MAKGFTKLKKATPLREQAYETIKSLILANELLPGERLTEEGLAAQFSISPTPIREALARLHQEGIVQIVAHKGAYVTPISRKDVHEIYQIRRALEPLAVKLSIEAIPAEELDRMEALFAAVEEEVDRGERQSFLESDLEFHNLTVQYCSNQRLIQIIGNMTDQLVRIRAFLGREPNLEVRTSFEQHQQILAALRQRDAAQAVQLLQEHLTFAEQRIAARLPEEQGS